MTQQVGLLLLLAVVLTLANACKPLHIDDAAYVAYAAHIAEEPLHPYAFEVYWNYHYQAANSLLAPPVVPYWLAAAKLCLGDDPLWWKISLLPFHLLLVLSLFVLFRRFLGQDSWALMLVALTVLSPALLPATNLMLDVPALALSLGAVALFLHAADEQSWPATLVAGLLAGVAMQTKYTAFVTPAVFLAYGLTHGRVRLAMAAAGLALGLFAGWEAFVAWQHGDSHFLLALQQRQDGLLARFGNLWLPLLTMTAGVAPGTLLLALYAVTRSQRCLAAAAVLLVAGLLLMGLVPASWAVFTRNADGRPRLTLESLYYLAAALLFVLCLAALVRQLLAKCRTTGRQSGRATFFLLLWLALEIGVYFALTPFPAARRVLGVVVVVTLLAGRLAALTRVADGAVLSATVVGAVCGVLVTVVDLQEAVATHRAADRAVALARGELQVTGRHGQTTWFSGAWGFSFYASRDGLVPMAPEHQVMRTGDLLVLVEQPVLRLDFRLDQAPLQMLAVIDEEDALPWRTVVCYYGGRTPLQHHQGPRLRLTVYRVLADFVPSRHGVLPALH